jgi:hypothetical protein
MEDSLAKLAPFIYYLKSYMIWDRRGGPGDGAGIRRFHAAALVQLLRAAVRCSMRSQALGTPGVLIEGQDGRDVCG